MWPSGCLTTVRESGGYPKKCDPLDPLDSLDCIMAVSLPSSTVLVFLKYPAPGAVKTRLAADVGPDRAAELYRGWIGTVFEQLQPVRGTARVVGYFAGGGRD